MIVYLYRSDLRLDLA